MKRKMLNRLMAASLAAIMTVGMVGCGDNNDSSNQGGNESQSNSGNQGDTGNQGDSGNQGGEVADGGEDVGPYGAPLVDPATGQTYDLGGMEIVIADWWTNPDDEVESEYNDAVHAYHDWLEETYNFTLRQEGLYGWGDGEGSSIEAFTRAATGAPEGNYIYVLASMASVMSAAQSGLMYDISTLDCLNLTESKWTMAGDTQLWTMGGKTNCWTVGPGEPRTGVFFNRTVLKDAGINPDDLYDWQASGEWTWDKFIEVMDKVQRDTNNDGEIDVYGCVQNNGNMIEMAVYSNGGSLIKQNADGTFALGVTDDASRQALHWATDEVTTKYFEPYDSGANWEEFKGLFLSGTAAFCVDDAYCGYANGWLNNTEGFEDFDFGWVAFPKGPQASNYTAKFSNNLFALPASYDADTAWKIMFAYNLWTEDIPGFEGYWGLEDNFYAGFPDTRAVIETAHILNGEGADGMTPLHPFISGIDTGAPFLWNLYAGADVDAVIDGVIAPWQTVIDEQNAKAAN